MQLTAYACAKYIQLSNGLHDGTYIMPKVDRHVILNVTADGVREVEVNVGRVEVMAWLSCIELARWRDTMKGKRL